MGQAVISQVLLSNDFELAVALDRVDSNLIGHDAGSFCGNSSGVKITSDLSQIFCQIRRFN